MDKLNYHLKEISKLVSAWKTEPKTLRDCQNAKIDTYVIGQVVAALQSHANELKTQCAMQTDAIERTARTFDAQLCEFEKYFHIQPQKEDDKKDAKEPNVKASQYALQEYKNKEDVPLLQYGVVNGLIVYRYGANDWVSCTPINISEQGLGDNFRSICCTNGVRCTYGKNCKYFHDPLYWPGSNHIQQFPRTNLVKQCPNFGNAASFDVQLAQLDFQSLRTLARYVAIMGLLIHRVATKT